MRLSNNTLNTFFLRKFETTNLNDRLAKGIPRFGNKYHDHIVFKCFLENGFVI